MIYNKYYICSVFFYFFFLEDRVDFCVFVCEFFLFLVLWDWGFVLVEVLWVEVEMVLVFVGCLFVGKEVEIFVRVFLGMG